MLQCNPGVGLKAFFDMVHLNPKKLVLFGAACSPVTDQIAKAAKHWNLVQVMADHLPAIEPSHNIYLMTKFVVASGRVVKKGVSTKVQLIFMH